MNKNSLAGLAAFFFLFGNIAFAQAGEEKIVITSITGKPEIIRQNQIIPASTGMTCQTNDILKTTPACVVDISMNGLVGCRVLPSSECLIASGSRNNMDIKLGEGNVILNLKKLPRHSAFRIETPTAVASVRGTQFWGRVDLQKIDNPVTTFAVREGTIEILAKSFHKNFTIAKGQALDIPKDASILPSLRPALSEELESMEQASSIKTSV